MRPDTSASSSAPEELCVSLERVQPSVTRGSAAEWIVGSWTENGNVADAAVRLTVAPASQTPRFTLGCGSKDGTASCGLGTVDSASVQRQLEAEVTVPTTATSVTSVRLTVVGSGKDVSKDAQASVTVSVSAPAAPRSPGSPGTSSSAPGISSGTAPTPTGEVTSPLAVGNLPSLNGTGSTLSPGGNASGLFPTLDPSSSDSQPAVGEANASTRPMADVSALPGGTSVMGAQIAGLIALAVAFILAVTRLSIRKRTATAGPVKNPKNGSK
jgi:hypothetical protein